MTFGELTFGELPFGEMTFGDLAFGETAFGEMSFGESSGHLFGYAIQWCYRRGNDTTRQNVETQRSWPIKPNIKLVN